MFEKHKKKGEQSYMLISSVNLISFLIWIFAENFIDAKPKISVLVLAREMVF